jgi:hypothetical protein
MESLALLPSLYASNLREKLLKTEYIMLSKMYVLFCQKKLLGAGERRLSLFYLFK